MRERRIPLRSILTLCVVGGVSLVAILQASAVENETFGVAPFPEEVRGRERGAFTIPLEVGATFEDAVRVYSRTDQALELVVYPTDAQIGMDGAISVGFRGSEPEGVGAWIRLEERSLTLPPHGEEIVTFQVDVGSADPTPELGAIVVENTARGTSDDLDQRLNVVVHTNPPNSPTTSDRVQSLFLRSPWIIVAILGLLLAAILIWLGARRARKPHDTISEPGELAKPEPKDEAPESSRPVLHRLGSRSEEEADEPRDLGEELTAVLSRFEGAISEVPEPDDDDQRPPLDLDPDAEDEPEPSEAEERPQKDNAQRSSRKLDYIPLDEL